MLLLGLAMPICAAAEVPPVQSVVVGFDGTYKVGSWTPLRVTLGEFEDPVRGHFEVFAADNDGRLVRTRFPVEGELLLKSGSQHFIYARFGRLGSPLQVDVVTADGQRHSRRLSSSELPAARRSDLRLIVTVGQSIDAAEALRTEAKVPAAELLVEQVDAARDLPTHWLGYDGVDTLILTTRDVEAYSGLAAVQVAAIDRWVRLGGKLLLLVGAQGENSELLAGNASLARLLPGDKPRVVNWQSFRALGRFADTRQSLSQHWPAERGEFRVRLTRLQNPRGKVLVSEQDGPRRAAVVIRAAHGLGQVTFVGLDLDQPLFAEWPGRPQLVAKLLSQGEDKEAAARTGGGQLIRPGYDDLSGQLRTALDQFDGVRMVPFFLIAGLVFAYALLIGPGDYFLLKFGLGRMRWTWVTFPLWAVLFALAAYGVGAAAKSPRPMANHVDLVDIDLRSRTVRGTCWTHLYSPQARPLDANLHVDQPLDVDPMGLLTWRGLPGGALGGVDRPLVDVGSAEYSVRFAGPLAEESDRPLVSGFPVAKWSTAALLGRWHGKLNADSDTQLAADIDGRLSGRVQNPLDVELTDCLLVHGRWAYRIGRVGPRERVALGRRFRATDLRPLLVRQRFVDTRDVTEAYDVRSLDVPRIVQMLMFHDAAGGRGYTGLAHRDLPELDLSGLLRLDRAVLVGRTPAAVTRVTFRDVQPPGENTRTWSFVRILCPVELAERRLP